MNANPVSNAESDPTARSEAQRLSPNQLLAFRAHLESELADVGGLGTKLRAEIAASIASRRSTTTEAEDPEGSNLAFEGAQTNAMLQQTARHAEEIADALKRIDDGTYGSCVRCGTAIAAGRLEARPASALCISCAS